MPTASCRLWLPLAGTCALVACGEPDPTLLRINPATVELSVGEAQTFGAFVVVEGSSRPADESVAWAVDDGAVVELTPAGGDAMVRALTPGATLLHATAEGLSAMATITVGTAPAVPTVTATSPADGALMVATPTDVAITFSVPMTVATLTAQPAAGACSGALQLSRDDFATCVGFTGPPVMSGGDTVATLTPTPALAHDATYKLRVTTAATSTMDVALAAVFTQATGFTIAPGEPCATGLVISQVYGGGGGTGAPYTNDFIELHNAGATPVSLGGKAIQYGGSGGNGVWGAQALPTVQIPAGGYYLIQQAAGATPSAALPTPDFVPSTAVAMSPTGGKVALTSTTNALNGACPTGGVLDVVGYGPSTNCAEGTPTAATSATTGVIRRGGGCIDASVNSTDFVVGAPAPRNGATPALVCVCFAP